MPPSSASNLTLKKEEDTTVRRNVRNHSPTRLGRLGIFPVTTVDLLKGVSLPCRTSALTCFLSCVVAKQEGLLASLAGIEGLRVVTLARSFKVKCRYFIDQSQFFSYKSILNSLLF
jgi:hypothetical protein